MVFRGVWVHCGRIVSKDLHYGNYNVKDLNLVDQLVRVPQVSWDKVFDSI